MSLSADVVVVNEYTIKRSDGSGSRGASPGKYVQGYMARSSAVETVTPIRKYDLDTFVTHYMARAEATESYDNDDVALSTRELKKQFAKDIGHGGVAFSQDDVSLSDERLRASSAEIQQLFDEGKTVMKTVLSFTEDYLRKNKLIPEDFHCVNRGDYRGHLDQMKLRWAIKDGLSKMSRSYDDLRYVGVIQVDTKQVHCHLAMVDAGLGRLMSDGTQRGKLDAVQQRDLRRGLDMSLDEHQSVRHLSSSVTYERQNVVSYVKRWAHEKMAEESDPQFLLACLPEDKRLWRAGTNRASMKRPNKLLREMVERVLNEADSPMTSAMAQIYEYAGYRREKEGLDPKQWQSLVDNGRERVVAGAMNAVYSHLKELSPEQVKVRTPAMNVMSMDYENLAVAARDQDDDLMTFGFRLRSYSARAEHHSEAREQNHRNTVNWEDRNDAGEASAASRVLYDFYSEEEEYHAQVAAKYRHFLNLVMDEDGWRDLWRETQRYGENLANLRALRADPTFEFTEFDSLEAAEQYGVQVHGVSGGKYMASGDQGVSLVDARIERMQVEYLRQAETSRIAMSSQGFRAVLHESQQPGREGLYEPEVTVGTEYDFDEVKGLDMHQMTYDFSTAVPVGDATRSRFIMAARRRAASVKAAAQYLDDTDQETAKDTLPLAEIASMNEMADGFEADQRASKRSRLVSRIDELAASLRTPRRSATYPIDHRVSVGLRERMAAAATQAQQVWVAGTEVETGTQRELGDRELVSPAG